MMTEYILTIVGAVLGGLFLLVGFLLGTRYTKAEPGIVETLPGPNTDNEEVQIEMPEPEDEPPPVLTSLEHRRRVMTYRAMQAEKDARTDKGVSAR